VPQSALPAPISLGIWPTPVEPAPRLAAAAGLAADALWIKRDDLIGLGGGGNKVRKLQYTCARRSPPARQRWSPAVRRRATTHG
jgi:L-cysteate sulfo-lyase